MPTDNAFTADDPLLDRNDLKKRFPHLPNSPSHLRRLEAKGWPAPIKLSARRRVWRLSSVVAYIKKRERENEQQPIAAIGDKS
jgi:hypothetical protein